MAEKPIKIKEMKHCITSTREDLLNEEANKILSKKGFVFSKYSPSQTTHNSPRRKRKIISKSNTNAELNSLHIPDNDYKLTQPIMRFKPRTDLERIYDTLMQFSSFPSDKSKNIINEQLNSLGLATVQKKEEENDVTVDSVNPESLTLVIPEPLPTADTNSVKVNDKKIKTMTNVDYSDNKSKIKIGKKRVDNSKARELHPDLYNKTYFKAVENYSLFKNSFFIPEKITTKSNFVQTRAHLHKDKKVFNKTSKYKISYDEKFQNPHTKSENPQISHVNQLNVSTPSELIALLNQKNKKGKEINLIKSLDNIELIKKRWKGNERKKNEIDYQRFEEVKKLAFPETTDVVRRGALFKNNYKKDKRNYSEYSSPNDKDYYAKINGLEEFQKKSMEKIVIDGVSYNKNDLEHLSTKILEKCKWRAEKNPCIEESFKAGSGKLMFTNGLSIVDFEKKYNLKG